jgi:hypothetical protein
VQADPIGCAVLQSESAGSQKKPCAQLASLAQLVGQLGLAPVQTKGAQGGREPEPPAMTSVQVPGVASHTSQPPPSQATLQQRESTQ